MNPIELENLGGAHPLNRAMRRVARHWPVVYSKLLCLRWEWTDKAGNHPTGGLIPYGATDGRVLILNPEGVEEMAAESQREVGDSVGYVAFLLVHEGLHAIFNHGFRLSRFADPEAANHAADYKVNEMVHARNLEIGTAQFPLPSWVLLDLKLSEPWATEQLYQELKRRNAPQQQQQQQPQPSPTPADLSPAGDEGDDTAQQPGAGGESGDGVSPDAYSLPAGDGDDATDGSGSGSPDGGPVDSPAPGTEPSGGNDADPSPDPGGRSPASQPGAAEDGDAAPSDGGGVGGGTGVGGRRVPGEDPRPGAGGADTFKPTDDELTDDELEKEIDEQNERIMIQDALDSHQCGTDPSNSARLAKERRAAEVQDWASFAEQFVETRCRAGWRAPYNHGVFVGSGMVAPGREGRKVGDIVLVVDSSGSIGQDAWDRFLQLGQYVLDDIRPERLFLLSCDTRVVEAQELVQGDTVPTSMAGGGGTSFKAAFDWIEDDPEDMAIDPLLLIYFTDGYCSDHKDMTPPHYPVLWLSYQAKADNFPWGEFAEITVN